MKDLNKYRGIFPAFYACYDEAGAVSPERTRALTEYLIGKGVTGLYVGGSSGECIYQSVAERKILLENVMAVAKGRIVIIAHVASNNTAEGRTSNRRIEISIILRDDSVMEIVESYLDIELPKMPGGN